MADVVQAILTAEDRGFTSTFEKALGATDSLASKLKSGVGFGVMTAIGTKAVDTVARGFGFLASQTDKAIDRFDTLNNYPKVMKSLGYSLDEARKSSQMMDKGIEGLPTTMDEMTSNVQILAATLGNLSKGEVNATSVGVAMNHMLLAGGKGSQAAARGFEQYSQMLAAGKVDQQAWLSMVTAAPAQMKQLAESLLGAGKGQKDLYEAMKAGTVTFDDFNKALVELDKNGGKSFASFEEQAREGTKGIATSMSNVKTAVVKNLANMISAGDTYVKSLGLFKDASGNVQGIAGIFDSIKGSVNSFFSIFYTKSEDGVIKPTETMTKVLNTALDVFGAIKSIGSSVGEVFSSIGQSLGGTGSLESFLDIISKIANFASKHSDAIAKVGVALVGISVVKNNPALSAISNSLTSLAGSGLQGLSTKLFGVKDGIDNVSKAGANAKSLLSAGAAFVMLGAGIAIAAVGFKLLADSAIALAAAGPAAIAVMFGLIAAISAMAYGASLIGTALTAGAVGFIAFGAAVTLIGAGLLLAATAMSMFVNSAITLAEAGAGAVAIMVGMVAVVVALGAAAVLLGPALLVAGAGMLLFGAGLALVGVAVFVAAAGMTMLAGVMPLIATFGPAAAAGILVFGTATIAAGAMVLGGAAMVMAAGALIVAGGALAIAGGALFIAFGGMMAVAAALSLPMVAALNAIRVSMASIRGTAMQSAAALMFMVKAVSVVQTGLNGLKAIAKTALSGLVSQFKQVGTQAQSAGRQAGTGFANGIKSGMSQARTVTTAAVNAILNAMKGAPAKAKYVGTMISAGMAAGMRSQLGAIKSAAAQMAAAADKAMQAKAKVSSPSKVTKKTGKWIGQGLVVGLISKIKAVDTAGKKVVGSLLKTMKTATKKNNYEAVASSVVKKLEKQVNKKIKTMDTGFDKLAKKLKGDKKAQKATRALKSKLDTAWSKALKTSSKKIENIGKKYQKLYDDIVQQRANFAERLGSVDSLFTEKKKNGIKSVLFTDFTAQTAQVNALGKNIEKLKTILPRGLMDEIISMDTADALKYTNAMLEMSTADIKAYGKTYTDLQNASKKVANTFYSDRLAEVKSKYTSAVEKEFKALKTKLGKVGQQAVQGFASGMLKNKKKLNKTTKQLVNSIVAEAKKKLKIHSPSKVFEQIGSYTGEGFVVGIDKTQRDVQQSIDSMLSAADFNRQNAQRRFNGSLSDEFDYNVMARYEIEVPLVVNGREFARATADDMTAVQSQREQYNNRKRGIK